MSRIIGDAREAPVVGDMRRGMDIGKSPGRGYSKFIWASCEKCGATRWVALAENGQPKSPTCKECSRAAIRGKNCPWWKGGRQQVGYGYVRIVLDRNDPLFHKVGNRIQEHRLVMIRHLGRLLEPHEIIHHINGIKDDNRIENLAIEDRRNHQHYTKRKVYQQRIRELEAEVGMLKSKVEGAVA